MKLLDANVFVYAFGADHEYRHACRKILRMIRAGTLAATVNVEAFQEILHYFHYTRRDDLGRRVLTRMVQAFPQAIVVTPSDMLSAAILLDRYPHLQARDSVHLATIYAHNLEGIISADRGFDIIEGLKRFDPKELAA